MKMLLPLILRISACGKDASYVHSITPLAPQSSRESHAVVGDGGAVDIVWVIDNSLSMNAVQTQVIANADKFMQEFSRLQGINWRMGLLSTDTDDSPYLGFQPLFDSASPDPVTTFRNAVRRLGLSGSGTEKTFLPVLTNLTRYPAFLRPSAHLVVIMVGDEREQSNMSAADFVRALVGHKAGRAQYVRVYGAMSARDFGCPTNYPADQVVYAGSPYEEAINATNGQVVSACASDFGAELAKLGHDIVASISSPVILLSHRPLPATIKVVYKGEALPPGPRAAGGKWLYDADANGVRFHNMEFVDLNERNVTITYEHDQGQVE